MGGIDGGRADKVLLWCRQRAGTAGGGTSGITRVTHGATAGSAAGCRVSPTKVHVPPPCLPSSCRAAYSEPTESGRGSSSSSRLCRIQ